MKHVFIARGMALLVVAPSVPSAASSGAIYPPSQIGAARTGADQEAVAKSCGDEAASFDARAQSHQQMADDYRFSGTSSAQLMVKHCERLVKEFRGVARDYRALAGEPRKMAKAAGQ